MALTCCLVVELFSVLLLLGTVDTQDLQRTQIFIRAVTSPGEFIFVRGGVSEIVGRGCIENATVDPCAVPIRHRVVPSDSGSSYRQLSKGDFFLDWYGREDGQSGFEGSVPAAGTPLMWTTDQSVDITKIVFNYLLGI